MVQSVSPRSDERNFHTKSKNERSLPLLNSSLFRPGQVIIHGAEATASDGVLLVDAFHPNFVLELFHI